MKTILGVLLVVCLMIPVAVLAEDNVTPIINEGSSIGDEPLDVTPIETIVKDVPVKAVAKYVPYTKSIITTILEFVGLEPVETTTEVTEQTIDVFVDDFKVATIPEGSKFSDMDVHEICLGYQYGTDNWYECEVAFL